MHASDFVGDDAVIEWDGATGFVTGTIKYVDNYRAFAGDEASGYFFPITLDNSYKGKKITVKRTSNGGGTPTTAANTEWVLRLTDGVGTKYAINYSNILVATLDFSGATLITE